MYPYSKIIMNSGQEYILLKTTEEVFNIINNNKEHSIISIKDKNKREIYINLNEISSIEPYKESKFSISII
ncbi:hypothetical protein [Clostridium sp. AWRP]|uniref:hypothetical protein n=1 Tax=Clostridium sp. AWRP TaxID=2212991 RepID=UPI000FD6D6DF|nr:hypothetical protein [Clostridium sp. AWRP]AZV58938.1 hypothetical protein DMR38_21450 [Clostridium sp. AWRP]